jgi:hypothetical protein
MYHLLYYKLFILCVFLVILITKHPFVSSVAGTELLNVVDTNFRLKRVQVFIGKE